MDDLQSVLKWSLLSIAAYFLAVSGAHFFEFKVPLLYIFYDLPSTLYQDKIISLMAFGWSMFFVAGYSSVKRDSLRSVRYIVFAGIYAVLMLTFINLFTDFKQYPTAHPWIYWLETIVLGAALIWITVLYKILKRRQEESLS